MVGVSVGRRRAAAEDPQPHEHEPCVRHGVALAAAIQAATEDGG